MDGVVVNTNDVKVNVGGGYFVGMTALEASEWVKRRKEGSFSLEQPKCQSADFGIVLLLEHARHGEGQGRSFENQQPMKSTMGSHGAESKFKSARSPTIHLNPIFSNAIAGPSKSNTPQSPVRPQLPTGETTGRLDEPAKSATSRKGKAVEATGSEKDDLMDAIEKFVDAQRIPSGSQAVPTDEVGNAGFFFQSERR